MRVEKEIFALQQLDCLIADGIVEQDRAQDRAFRLDIRRQPFIEKRIT